jgi:nicotinamide riboside kinase
MKTKVIVNLFGGPGVGKSTAAFYLMAKLKMNGVDCEYTPEFAKDKVWEGNLDVFNCQFFVTGRQAWQIRRLFNKVEVIITDSPIALGAPYADSSELAACCLKEFEKYKDVNYNIVLSRSTNFVENGRRHSQKESKELDNKVTDLLEKNNIEYITISPSEKNYDELVKSILKKLS